MLLLFLSYALMGSGLLLFVGNVYLSFYRWRHGHGASSMFPFDFILVLLGMVVRVSLMAPVVHQELSAPEMETAPSSR